MKIFLLFGLTQWAFYIEIELSKADIHNILYFNDKNDQNSEEQLFLIQTKYKSKSMVLDAPTSIFQHLEILILKKEGVFSIENELKFISLDSYMNYAQFTGKTKDILKLNKSGSSVKEWQGDWKSELVENGKDSTLKSHFYLYNSASITVIFKLEITFKLQSMHEHKYRLMVCDIDFSEDTNNKTSLYKEKDGKVDTEFNNVKVKEALENILVPIKYSRDTFVLISSSFPKEDIDSYVVKKYIKDNYGIEAIMLESQGINEKDFLKFMIVVIILIIVTCFLYVTIKYKSYNGRTHISAGMKKNSIIKLD